MKYLMLACVFLGSVGLVFSEHFLVQTKVEEPASKEVGQDYADADTDEADEDNYNDAIVVDDDEEEYDDEDDQIRYYQF